MKIVKITGLILLVTFVGIQFVPTKRNRSDIVSKTDFLLVNNSPKAVSALLQVSCYDCHSNNTNYPWYISVQPVAWFMAYHVNGGKDELNFNEWGTFSNRKKRSKLKFIINQLRDDEMPLSSYTFIHRDALISKTEKKLLMDYMTNIKDSLQAL